MRRVEVEKIKDKCLDLKKCISQQNTVFGFLSIINLKRTKINTSLRPNCVLTEDKFDPVHIHTQVRKTGRYNFEEVKIQLPSKINFDLLEQLSSDYWDYQLKSFLKFGFPLDFPRDKENQLSTTDNSHASARAYPEHIDTYQKWNIMLSKVHTKTRLMATTPMCPLSCLARRQTVITGESS